MWKSKWNAREQVWMEIYVNTLFFSMNSSVACVYVCVLGLTFVLYIISCSIATTVLVPVSRMYVLLRANHLGVARKTDRKTWRTKEWIIRRSRHKNVHATERTNRTKNRMRCNKDTKMKMIIIFVRACMHWNQEKKQKNPTHYENSMPFYNTRIQMNEAKTKNPLLFEKKNLWCKTIWKRRRRWHRYLYTHTCAHTYKNLIWHTFTTLSNKWKRFWKCRAGHHWMHYVLCMNPRSLIHPSNQTTTIINQSNQTLLNYHCCVEM